MKDLSLQMDVAIKTLHQEHVATNRDEFLREAKVMIGLNHHCVVRLIGVSTGPPLLMVGMHTKKILLSV
jgi:tyrosine-protein kinase